MRLAAVLCPILAATACAGPRPEVPSEAAVQLPASWRNATSEDREVDSRWWTLFGDATLTAFVDEALARNDDVAIAAGRVEEARAEFGLARAQRLPQLDLQFGGGPQRTVNAFGSGSDQTIGQAQAVVAYDADLFGRLRSSTAAARAALLGTEAARDGIRLAVASSVADGYLTLLALDARLGVLRATLDARAEALKLARRRAEAGYSPTLDLAQAQADFHSTEQLIPVAEIAARRQENGLSILLGRAPGPLIRGRPMSTIAPPEVQPMLPSGLLRRRPDVFQAEQQVVAADRRLDAARAAFMPSLRLTGSGGLVGSTLLPDPLTIFSLGGSILAPLLNGGRLRGQERAQAARRNQAAFAYRRTVLRAFGEVEDALDQVRRYGEQERSLGLQLDAQGTAFRAASARYRAGYSPFLEQLDAQRSLLAVQLALVDAHANRLTTMVRLLEALGGGWNEGAELAGSEPARRP